MVNNPYIFTDNDLALISQHFTNDHKDWNKAEFDILKKKIREFLIAEQGQKCTYCKSKVRRGTTLIPIEHVVPKKKHPQFTFENNNLVIACPMCNTKKSTKETLTNTNVATYPTQSAGFLIINPYLDEYDDHLEIIENIFICAKTMKGEKTIEICKLDRLDLAMEKAEDFYISHSDVYTMLMHNLIHARDAELQRRINEILLIVDQLIFEDTIPAVSVREKVYASS